METPTLSKRQQQRSLSAKKGKKGTLKTIVNTPFANYWPLLQGKDVDKITNALNEHIQLLKPLKLQIPWKIIKYMPRDKRKGFRLEYSQKTETPQTIGDRSRVAVGVNDVTRNLEKSNLVSVLIADDVNPHFMVKHIVDMSVLNTIPVLIVPNLREILKNKMGMKSVAIGFKKNLDQHSSYFILNEEIKNVFSNYPVPKNHINYPRQKLFDAEDEETNVKDQDNNLSICSTCIDEEESKEVKDITSQKFYLLRKSKTERTFIPKEDKIDLNSGNTTDFISFEGESQKKKINPDKPQKNNRKRKVDYQGLVVKVVKANNNREQQKIEKIKRKKK